MHIVVEGSELQRIAGILNKAVAEGMGEMLDTAGALIESQTRRRIAVEKSGPEGPWTEWSSQYAQTRHGNQSLLISGGGLLDSIEHHAEGDEVQVGSNLVYAAAHQHGLDMSILSTGRRVHIPARPYLFISDENERELERVLADFITGRLHA
jgi:phage virion morphogenesis protein